MSYNFGTFHTHWGDYTVVEFRGPAALIPSEKRCLQLGDDLRLDVADVQVLRDALSDWLKHVGTQ